MMKMLIIFFLLFGWNAMGVYSQDFVAKESGNKHMPDTIGPCNPEMVFTIVEVMPRYNGGLIELESHLNKIMDFDQEVSGTAYVSVYVNCESKAYRFRVVRGIDEGTDEKLIECLRRLQNWKAGTQRKKKVDCHTTAIAINIHKGRLTITNK